MAQKRVVTLNFGEEAHEDLAKRGIMFLSGEIDEENTYNFTLAATSALERGYLPKGRLLVVLNSPGGNVQDGLAIYDTIRMLVDCGVHVDVFGLGLVASMGTVILQAGSRRLSSPHTQFLIHQISDTIGYYKSEEVSQGEERIAESKRLNEILLGIVATRSGIDINELRKRCIKTDYWLDPESARKMGTHGLVDEVVISPELVRNLVSSKE